MTHNELKSKIDDMRYFGGLGNVSQFYNVIRQVVELHKPSGIDVLWCNECSYLNTDGKTIFYPCPTIKAIERGIK